VKWIQTSNGTDTEIHRDMLTWNTTISTSNVGL